MNLYSYTSPRTQEGPKENPGVNPRALQELFRVSDERKEDYTVEIGVAVLEIYNEQIRDLLVPPAKAKEKKYGSLLVRNDC